MRWLLAIAAVTVLAGGLRAREALHPDARQSVDEHGYVSVAVGLADSGRYGHQSLHWAPGAPVMFALAAKAGGHVRRGGHTDIPAAYWAQWAVGTALIPLVFLLAQLLGGPWAGLAAAAVVATYPPLIAVTGDLLSEPLGALLLTASMLALVARRPALAGALLGAAVLTRANLLLAIFAIAPFARPGRVRFLAAALLPVALWSLNVSHDTGRLVLVSNGGGSSLFVGTLLPGHGTLPGAKAALREETQRFAGIRVAHARELPGELVMDAVAARDPGVPREAALRREAWRNLGTYPWRDPAGFAAMTLAKLPRLWLKPSPRSAGLRTTPLRAWHLLVVLLALAGLVRGRGPAPVVALLVAFTAFHLVVVALPRYALPVLPVLIAAGAGGWGRRPEPAPPEPYGVVVDSVNVKVLL